MAFKMVTFSMDLLVIDKLQKLKDFMHNSNQSNIVSLLIEKEYRRQMELREED